VTIYFDTSALAKLVRVEPETTALRTWLGERPREPWVTNIIGVVEVQRFAARVSQPALTAAMKLVARVGQLDLSPVALARAATLAPPEVRTLDALHIASALELSDLEAIVTYDLRMITASADYGLPVISPGM
jgi:predicted nucleic acid-binding protein